MRRFFLHSTHTELQKRIRITGQTLNATTVSVLHTGGDGLADIDSWVSLREVMSFSCFGKKRTKRSRLKEALKVALPRAPAALLKNPPGRI